MHGWVPFFVLNEELQQSLFKTIVARVLFVRGIQAIDGLRITFAFQGLALRCLSADFYVIRNLAKQ